MTDALMERVVVREAHEEDVGRLSLVADATFLESFAGIVAGDALIIHCQKRHAPDYLRQLLEGGARAWLAELDDAPIGYALLTAPELDAAREGDIELKKIYVLSRFHGTGIAARLLDTALAQAEGHARLLLGVKDDNHYTKQGFRQIGTRRFDVGGALYDDVVLARDLERTES